MAGSIQLAKAAVAASVRFARTYPHMCGIAVVVYAVSALLSMRYPVSLMPQGKTAQQLLFWSASLPRSILLAPVWTALLRSVILREKGRRYSNWDHRTRRVLLVTVILSAILTAGGVPFALYLDVLPRFPVGRRLAGLLLGAVILGTMASWWLVMRLAIAPALAAAGTRRYAIDTSFSFTRRWLITIFVVKLLIYAPLFGPLFGGEFMLAGFRTDRMDLLRSAPVSVAAETLVTGLADLIDMAAMGLVAVRIVRARKGEDDDEAASGGKGPGGPLIP